MHKEGSLSSHVMLYTFRCRVPKDKSTSVTGRCYQDVIWKAKNKYYNSDVLTQDLSLLCQDLGTFVFFMMLHYIHPSLWSNSKVKEGYSNNVTPNIFSRSYPMNSSKTFLSSKGFSVPSLVVVLVVVQVIQEKMKIRTFFNTATLQNDRKLFSAFVQHNLKIFQKKRTSQLFRRSDEKLQCEASVFEIRRWLIVLLPFSQL